MNEKLLTRDIKRKATEMKADLVGIAAIECFAETSAEQHPSSIFPECRSVIVVGRRILRGSLRGIEEGTNFSSTYGTFGYRWLEDNFLAQTTYDLTCYLESQGWEAVPLFGYSQEGMAGGVPVASGKPAPNVIVDIEFAAQAAGLGEPGAGGFFITPRFGIRQRFAMILTDLPLEPDSAFDESLCSFCGACFEACPFAAIRPGNTRTAGVPGAEREVAVVDYEICSRCPNGAMRAPGRGNAVDRIAAACGRACMVQLERAKKCEGRFVNPFRKRAAWALDLCQRRLTGPTDAGGERAAELGCGRNFDQIGQDR